jgi:hypothetical protein
MKSDPEIHDRLGHDTLYSCDGLLFEMRPAATSPLSDLEFVLSGRTTDGAADATVAMRGVENGCADGPRYESRVTLIGSGAWVSLDWACDSGHR